MGRWVVAGQRWVFDQWVARPCCHPRQEQRHFGFVPTAAYNTLVVADGRGVRGLGPSLPFTWHLRTRVESNCPLLLLVAAAGRVVAKHAPHCDVHWSDALLPCRGDLAWGRASGSGIATGRATAQPHPDVPAVPCSSSCALCCDLMDVTAVLWPWGRAG